MRPADSSDSRTPRATTSVTPGTSSSRMPHGHEVGCRLQVAPTAGSMVFEVYHTILCDPLNADVAAVKLEQRAYRTVQPSCTAEAISSSVTPTVGAAIFGPSG